MGVWEEQVISESAEHKNEKHFKGWPGKQERGSQEKKKERKLLL